MNKQPELPDFSRDLEIVQSLNRLLDLAPQGEEEMLRIEERSESMPLGPS